MTGALPVMGDGVGAGEASPRTLDFVSPNKGKLLKSFKPSCVGYNRSKTKTDLPSVRT